MERLGINVLGLSEMRWPKNETSGVESIGLFPQRQQRIDHIKKESAWYCIRD